MNHHKEIPILFSKVLEVGEQMVTTFLHEADKPVDKAVYLIKEIAKSEKLPKEVLLSEGFDEHDVLTLYEISPLNSIKPLYKLLDEGERRHSLGLLKKDLRRMFEGERRLFRLQSKE
ncbi:MAG: hypothetical protein KAR24_02030 [Candidatus Pacebacteria bacterium]|nr:hypothetical protein [Candidatus Paceibacterota bacterium]